MSVYGIVIRDKDGWVLLDEQSMVQSWGNTMVDNIDEDTPVVLMFRYPDNTGDILDFRLSITYDLYRTYSDTEEEEDLRTSNDGDHTHSLTTETAVTDQTITMDFGTQQSSTVHGHSHTLETAIVNSDCTALRDHEHVGTHSFSSIPEGSHTHEIDDHAHDLKFEMVEMGLGSLNVDIYINGDLFMDDVGPEDSFDLEVPPEFLNYPGWNKVEIFSSEGLSRVNVNYFTQIYLNI